MSRLDELLTEQFYRWELRGRGWQTFEAPVALEPPFREFLGHVVPSAPSVDDGRKHTAISGFIERLTKKTPRAQEAEFPVEKEPEPVWREAGELIELALTLPISRAVPPATVETFIRHIARPDEQLSLEISAPRRKSFRSLSRHRRRSRELSERLAQTSPASFR